MWSFDCDTLSCASAKRLSPERSLRCCFANHTEDSIISDRDHFDQPIAVHIPDRAEAVRAFVVVVELGPERLSIRLHRGVSAASVRTRVKIDIQPAITIEISHGGLRVGEPLAEIVRAG